MEDSLIFKACDFATALNSYSSAFTATCSDDTVHVCTSTMTEAHNGDTFNLGSSHNSFITVTATTFSGGDNDSTTYTMNLTQDEHHIYGSSRLGVSKHAAATKQVDFGAQVQREKGSDKIFLALLDGIFINQGVDEPVNEDQSAQTFDDLVISLNGSAESIPGVLLTETLGEKRYEFTNHLGNVLLTTSDRRLYVDGNTDGILDYYVADDLSYSDFYPYGMAMVGRTSNLGDYRFGFSGEEMENEVNGNENLLVYQLRFYDPRLGRWFSEDPYDQFFSPYSALGNMPTSAVDGDGGYVFIVGGPKDAELLSKALNAYYQTTDGKKVLDEYINSPDHHLFIADNHQEKVVKELDRGKVKRHGITLGVFDKSENPLRKRIYIEIREESASQYAGFSELRHFNMIDVSGLAGKGSVILIHKAGLKALDIYVLGHEIQGHDYYENFEVKRPSDADEDHDYIGTDPTSVWQKETPGWRFYHELQNMEIDDLPTKLDAVIVDYNFNNPSSVSTIYQVVMVSSSGLAQSTMRDAPLKKMDRKMVTKLSIDPSKSKSMIVTKNVPAK